MGAEDRILLSDNVVPSHYDLTLEPNLDTYKYTGSVTITVDVKSPTKEVTMHARELGITKAFYSKDGAEVQAESWTCARTEWRLILAFNEDIPAGQQKITVEFWGVLNDQMAGFYRSLYKTDDGKDGVMAVTQFEANDARRAFPCWDEPARKAVFKVTVIHETRYMALSNMPEASCEYVTPTKKKTVFLETPIMSTYLLAFIVSELEYVQGQTNNGTLVRILCRPGKLSECDYALEMAIKGLEFYNDFFGIPYPLPKCDQVAVPDFSAGAMENWGLITYREVLLFITEQSPIAIRQRCATVICHELAHQWFGNLVTMQWWDGLWLNEGFANFMQTYATDLLNPQWKLWEQYVANESARAFKLDALRSSHPILMHLDSAQKVEEVFDAISYCKGGSTIRMIFSMIGRANFQKGLQIYMNRHKYSNTETSDLWAAWEEASGVPMSKILHTWTKEMGFPVVFVKTSADGNKTKLSLEQKWFLADGSTQAGDDAKVWQIPVTYYNPKSGKSPPENRFLTQKSETFTIDADPSAWLLLNKDRWGFFRTSYTPEMLSMIAKDFHTPHLSVEDKVGLLTDALALATAAMADPTGLIPLVKGVKNETNANVVGEAVAILGSLAGVFRSIGDEALIGSFAGFAKSVFIDSVKSVGFDNKPGDDSNVKTLRNLLLNFAATYAFDDPFVSSEAEKRFAKFCEDRKSMTADGRSAVFKICVKNGGEKVWNKLIELHSTVEDPAERSDYYAALGSVKDIGLKTKTLEWCVTDAVRPQDLFHVLIGVASTKGGGKLCSGWIMSPDSYEKLNNLLGKTSMILFNHIVRISGVGLYSEADAARVQEFWDSKGIPQITKTVQQTVEQIRVNAKFVGEVKKSVLVQPGYVW